jgi:hypothetical protein
MMKLITLMNVIRNELGFPPHTTWDGYEIPWTWDVGFG